MRLEFIYLYCIRCVYIYVYISHTLIKPLQNALLKFNKHSEVKKSKANKNRKIYSVQ